MSPREMNRCLPPIFETLKTSGARIVHYKICSTFDSSPQIGSIGRAIELGQRVFQSRFVPLLAGAPSLGRYCFFGNLFARSGLDSEPHRLDRHPTMSRHPVTPMDEADLRIHLRRQTKKTAGLMDVLRIESANPSRELQKLVAAGSEIVLFDVINARHLERIGELISLEARAHGPLFMAGSSGIEYALTSAWRKSGRILSDPPRFEAKRVRQTVVASGSCSPVTDRQIARALKAGFVEVPLKTTRLIDRDHRAAALDDALQSGLKHLAEGRSVIFHTARSPADPRLARTTRALDTSGGSSAEILGSALGELLRLTLKATGLRRAVVTGGDTSGFAARALGVEALEFAAPMTPGSPLCRIHSSEPAVDGCEIVFKGGQNGRDSFFLDVLAGVQP
jgi:uncharacterized protein YgbK (DUF1537 family)